MRIIACLLSLMMLAMSCLPCADSAIATWDSTDKAVFTKTSSQQDNHGHQDDCSPFCHCTCCTSLFTYVLQSLPFSDVEEINKALSSYLPDNLINVSLPVWQPPQLHV